MVAPRHTNRRRGRAIRLPGNDSPATGSSIASNVPLNFPAGIPGPPPRVYVVVSGRAVSLAISKR